ncbi:MAG: cellulase family glycosylhydrolase [Spirochaetaceae bacterium]|jgi:hypothetical protein|nr:cellulase family glycosylhydrolase [Spirochaetaceae bacterium]
MIRAVLYAAALPVLCVLFSCSSLSFAGPDPYLIPEDFFGISPDRSPLNKEDYDLLDNFGAVWIRTTVRWTGVEPEEGAWDFARWDLYVEKAKAAGKKIIFILGFDSEWLYPDRREHRDLTEREIPYFLKYVEQVVSRYRGRVDAFEIWNEPNGFFWYGSNEHFFALSAAAAKKIKEVDPQATVLAGSTLWVPRSFLRGMFNAGAFEHTDGISVHPYASDPAHTVKQIRKLKKILGAVGYNRPIWITEVGYATGGIYFSFNGLKRYPEYIVKTLSGLAAQGVRSAVWYELMDDYNRGEAPNRWNPSYFFGLIYPDKTVKPGAEAFMLSTRYLTGAEYRPEFPLREGVPGSITSLYFRGPGETKILLLWNSRPRQIPLRLEANGAAGENLVRHSIENGEAEILGPADRAQTVHVGRDPLFLTWTGEGTPQLTGHGR